MARSIWTAEERELLVQYVAQYKAGDEDARILLLENRVIPKYLATFPPREVESDADEPEHEHEQEHVNLHEAERRMKQVCSRLKIANPFSEYHSDSNPENPRLVHQEGTSKCQSDTTPTSTSERQPAGAGGAEALH